MKSKMTTNSQLSTTKPKKTQKQNQTKQTRTGTESEMEITLKVISGEVGRGRLRENVQGISSINGRYKIDRARLRIV